MKMNIESRFKQWAFKRHILVKSLKSGSALKVFLKRFRVKYVSTNLIRIGDDCDGGYLIPNNLDQVSYCFSPGVDYVASFESELSKKYGIKSYMADASVREAPISDENFEFIPKFLSARTNGNFITLSDWIQQSIGNEESNCILQMDIEGGEYDVLTYESADLLAKFSTMVIEFHGLQDLFEANFLTMFSSIFEKIYLNFSICHVHPNNDCGSVELDGIVVPRVIEISFIRNDLIDSFICPNDVVLPHKLDRRNVKNKDEIFMPEVWWKDIL